MKSSFRQYALLGSGRLARHLAFYFHHLRLPFVTWSRRNEPQFNTFSEIDSAEDRLAKTLAESSHVLLAIKDEAIEEVANRIDFSFVRVHFSGARAIPDVVGAHPLMTFGEELMTPDTYRSVPFVVDEGHFFAEVLPGLPNPHFVLNPEKKTYYHALCSLAGNASYLLLQQIGEEFEKEFSLPRQLLQPYLEQVVANSTQSGRQNFTGPVARGDWTVVHNHLKAMGGHPALQSYYRSYLHLAEQNGANLPEELKQWT